MNAEITLIKTFTDRQMRFCGDSDDDFLSNGITIGYAYGNFTFLAPIQSNYIVGENAKDSARTKYILDKETAEVVNTVKNKNDFLTLGVFGADDEPFFKKNHYGSSYWDLDSTSVYDSGDNLVFTFKASQTYCFYQVKGVYYILELSEDEYYSKLYRIDITETKVNSPRSSNTSNAQKVIENGQLYIIFNGVKYAVTGSSIL